MDKNRPQSSHFLLGVIVGVVITLMFTTKKGRRIFKALTEEGFQKFSDLEGMLDERRGQELAESTMGDQDVIDEESLEDTKPNGSGTKISTGRRFFKGVNKKS